MLLGIVAGSITEFMENGTPLGDVECDAGGHCPDLTQRGSNWYGTYWDEPSLPALRRRQIGDSHAIPTGRAAQVGYLGKPSLLRQRPPWMTSRARWLATFDCL